MGKSIKIHILFIKTEKISIILSNIAALKKIKLKRMKSAIRQEYQKVFSNSSIFCRRYALVSESVQTRLPSIR